MVEEEFCILKLIWTKCGATGFFEGNSAHVLEVYILTMSGIGLPGQLHGNLTSLSPNELPLIRP